MPRHPRIHFSGAVYHVMARGVDGRTIFLDDGDRERFLTGLDHLSRQNDARVLAHCLMPNHFHAAIKVGPIPLSTLMQRLLTSHSIFFNKKYERTGHLFQARYKAIACLDDAYLTALIRYIHNNPVRAGLVADPASWKWSSYGEYASSTRDPLIDNADDLPPLEKESVAFDPWPTTARPILLRGEPVVRPSLDQIGTEVAGARSTSVLRRGSRRRDVSALKRGFVHAALEQGYSLSAVARWLGVTVNAAKHYAPK